MVRNDITGDSIANTKGSAEKYAQGWDALFRHKPTYMTMDADGVHMSQADGSTLSFTSEGAMRLTGMTPESAEKWLQCFKRQGFGVAEPTTVMALDFHDSPRRLVRLTPVFIQSRTKEEIYMDEWLEKMGYNDFTCEDDDEA